jgi:hypothetical protein
MPAAPLDPVLQHEVNLWWRAIRRMPNPALSEKLARTLVEIFIEGAQLNAKHPADAHVLR